MSLASFLAMSPAPGQGSAGGAAGLVGLLPFVLIMVIFYFLIIRPQQQRQKQHALMLKELKKGDRILMGKYSGTQVEIDGEDHLILREDDVLGIIAGK